MRKDRAAPSAVAATAGSAVPWRESLASALAEARQVGRPVFWYVPTVAGSPMDRQPEIDRYMLAGPFSWPSTVALLRDHFVPVREVPTGAVQRDHDLRRNVFIEPGWLVLDGDGRELLRMQQITTFHPQWFEAPLRRVAGLPDVGFPCTEALADAWAAYRGDEPQACEPLLAAVLARDPTDDLAAEAMFLRGAVERRTGRTAAALATWRSIAERWPATTWAAKAAMEAEGHGPFTRCFEDFLPLPASVFTTASEGSRAPRGTYSQEQLWQRGVRFLLAAADEDGIVRDSIYDFGGTDSLPNVHFAITCLCGQALLVAAHRCDAGRLHLDGDLRADIGRRLQVLRRLCGTEPPLARADRDEILWACAYRLRFLARWAGLRPDDRAAIATDLAAAVADVVALQPDDGVWFHEYGNPFAIATALTALADAHDLGIAVDAKVVERGLRALAECRAKTGAFTYGYPQGRAPRVEVRAAAGRMPLCELALLRWQQSDAASLQRAVDAALEHHARLAAVRKYDDHADADAYGGFFFWFDMLGRSEATMRLADATAREARRTQQLQIVLDLPEFDGCFVDSHELGRAYGTAMALLCLATLDP